MKVLDIREPIAVQFVLGTAIIFVFSLWGVGFQFIKGEALKTLEYNFDAWQSNAPFSYTYQVESGCMLTFSSRVLVVDGVAFFEHSSGHTFEITIEKMFKKAEKAITQAASIKLDYHPAYLFPEDINVDWNKDIHDDECFYRIRNFEVIEETR
ncbi:DUF6174 domain-containing protein [Pseudoalteromonas luteoviolacea]|uniref:DUF6174 domain-containing protein n=1 Tax=Pseudoalteromonas luteoviolacea TaxID=43657 RepID=UPI00068DCF98|nr:DUF6174 domain-containing protein [Pseudoalteromonas luteoviolacea]